MTTIEVGEQGTATIQRPMDLKPGTHRVLVTVLDGPEVATAQPTTADFPRCDIPWPFPGGETFRREDMYGDDGR